MVVAQSPRSDLPLPDYTLRSSRLVVLPLYLMNPLRLVVAVVALVAVLVVFAFAYSALNGNTQHSNTLVLNASNSGHTFTIGKDQTVQVQLQDNWPVPGSSLVWRVSA